MMKKLICALLSVVIVFTPYKARADLFGGDVAVLIQILVQAIEQVVRLQQIINTGRDTLGLLRDINSGARSGLDVIRIINPRFDPGIYGNLKDPANVLRALKDIYGQIPKSQDSDLIESQDQSVAEVISMNRNLYDYADQVDHERERIMAHSEVVSPQGAAKLQNQSLAVMIGVMTQLLRSQSQMLKIMAQNMALQNRKEKITSQQFIDKYQGVSQSLGTLPQDVKLPSIKNGGVE